MLSISEVKIFRGEKKIIDIDHYQFDFSLTYQIIGETGEGKSTLFECLAGVDKPHYGDIVIDSLSLYDSGFMELSLLRKRLGIMFDLPGLLSNQSIYDNLKLAIDSRNIDLGHGPEAYLIENYLKFFKLENILGDRPGNLSHEQRKIIAFIRAIVTKPDFLIFDGFSEFFKGNFIEVYKEFLEKIKNNGVGGIFFASERMTNFNFDKNLILKQGKIYEC